MPLFQLLYWFLPTVVNNYYPAVPKQSGGGIDAQEFLTIEYSSDGGISWKKIDDNVDATALSYEWIIPELESDDCLIRITDNDNNSFIDESNNTFTISLHANVDESKPFEFAMLPNNPNPFNPSTTINFTLPSADFTSLVIYNLMGQKIRELVSEELDAGAHTFVWDGKDDVGMAVSSGIYLSRLKSGKHTATVRCYSLNEPGLPGLYKDCQDFKSLENKPLPIES